MCDNERMNDLDVNFWKFSNKWYLYHIDQNDANDKNPILISKVPKLEADARVDKLKDLRAALPSSVEFDKAYPLWGIPFVVKDIVDVAGMETTLGSPAWTAFPNCDLPTPPSAFVDPIPVPDTIAFKDPFLLRFDLVGPEAPSVPSFDLETTAPVAPLCHAAPIANAPVVKPIADDTALIVQLALDAGAILIGKANLDQFATGLVGTRSAYGPVRNVRNEDFITGGSSSGSAAAVALGWASFSYGTDTAGSGRVPAGFNHLVGYKPTPGLLSNDLTFPAVRSVDTNTILTLNAEDSRYVAKIIKKYDPTDPYARPEADTLKCSATLGGTKKFRFGIPAEIVDPAFPNTFMKDRLADIWASDPNGKALYLAAIERMKKIGGTAVEFEYRPWEDVARLGSVLILLDQVVFTHANS
jgi:Asp-tRNA(Asn)/Glu-tRNA(Gln) amidotransferase A subunit family amidase